MGDIGVSVEEFDPVRLMEPDDGCITIRTRAYLDSSRDTLFSLDSITLFGKPKEIHAFGQAIVAATEGLVEKPVPVTEDDELGVEARP